MLKTAVARFLSGLHHDFVATEFLRATISLHEAYRMACDVAMIESNVLVILDQQTCQCQLLAMQWWRVHQT